MRPSHLRIVALAASLQIAAAVPSPAGLKSDVTILISNDLQGELLKARDRKNCELNVYQDRVVLLRARAWFSSTAL